MSVVIRDQVKRGNVYRSCFAGQSMVRSYDYMQSRNVLTVDPVSFLASDSKEVAHSSKEENERPVAGTLPSKQVDVSKGTKESGNLGGKQQLESKSLNTQKESSNLNDEQTIRRNSQSGTVKITEKKSVASKKKSKAILIQDSKDLEDSPPPP